MSALDIKINGVHSGVTSKSLNLVEGTGIALTPTGSDTVQIDFDGQFNGSYGFRDDVWHTSQPSGDNRFYFNAGGTTYIKGYSDTGSNIVFRDSADNSVFFFGGNATGPKIVFGPDSDTNLYRSAANTLKTDDSFYAVGTITSEGGLTDAFKLSGSTWKMDNEGKQTWGGDTNLYRNAADELRTDDNLIVSATLQMKSDAGTIFFGPPSNQDVVLYRDGANILKTDDSLKVAGVYYGGAYSGANRSPGDVVARRSATTGAYYFGDGDIYLYYAGANLQTTVPLLASAGTEQVYVGAIGPSSKAGLTFSNSEDVNLYRSAANILKTDDAFYSVGNVKTDAFFTTGNGGVIVSEANAGGYIEIDEATGDAGGATDKVRLFCKDVAGKTKLYAVFQTGAIQLVATEP